ncbi:MAG: hypothetical protein HY514_00555 [Candidatus Aenigmarchaeota archaeon]|nr:hypothetical protein [Candidatus Aenigmarchaeota archaeon]
MPLQITLREDATAFNYDEEVTDAIEENGGIYLKRQQKAGLKVGGEILLAFVVKDKVKKK